MVTGETEAPLSLHFDFILQKNLLFFVEMATKGYATLKGAVSVTQRKKHSSSQMSIVTPTSIYSLHRPPKIEIMLWHCFYVKRHTYCTCNKGWCVMDAHRLWSDMPSASSSQCVLSLWCTYGQNPFACAFVSLLWSPHPFTDIQDRVPFQYLPLLLLLAKKCKDLGRFHYHTICLFSHL